MKWIGQREGETVLEFRDGRDDDLLCYEIEALPDGTYGLTIGNLLFFRSMKPMRTLEEVVRFAHRLTMASKRERRIVVAECAVDSVARRGQKVGDQNGG